MSASEPIPAAAGHMPCPRCRVDLLMSERQGIEIDYCPKCRGVWLDRGELDKLIERSEQQAAVMPPPQPPVAPQPYAQPPGQSPWTAPPPPPEWTAPAPRYHDDDDDDHHRYGRRGRRKSWLGQLFDD